MDHLEVHRPPSEIREEMSRILHSADFDASERNRRFLEYVVEETLAGRGGRIKAYTIATTVFGRDAGFDAATDPIVRIEARRLRRSLERFYLKEGRGDRLRISIPKGSYVPRFDIEGEARAAGEATEPTAPPRGRSAPRHHPSILVTPFEQEGDPSVCPNFRRGFTRQVVVGLARFSDLVVFGPEIGLGYGDDLDRAHLRDELGVDFVLSGGATLSAERFTVNVLLTDVQDGRTVWAHAVERALQPAAIYDVRDEVAGRVTQVLGQPYGFLFARRARDVDGKPPSALDSYDCVVRFYKYWRTHARELHESARRCLEAAISSEPDYADAIACLALVYVDAHRFGYGAAPAGVAPNERALELARRAIELAPCASRAHHALGLALWFGNDVEDGLRALERGLELNPNDTEIMADLGLRYVLRARWQEARPLLKASFERNAAQPTAYRLGFFFDHYVHGRFHDALIQARQLDAPNVIHGHAAVAMAAAKCGRHDEAAQAVARVLDIAPDYGTQVEADLAGRNVEPGLRATIVDGLRAAGLPMAA